jgi:hypothetical protein
MAPPAATFATALEAMVQALYETWVDVGDCCRMSRRKSAFRGASQGTTKASRVRLPIERDGIGWKRRARTGV